MIKMTYEVQAYRSQYDFDHYTFSALEDGYLCWSDAFEQAGRFLLTYPVVKVQSYDREIIHILTKS